MAAIGGAAYNRHALCAANSDMVTAADNGGSIMARTLA
jgi:hypothetical protein